MMERKTEPAVEETTSPPRGLEALLVAVDLSPFSDRVLGRVACLPLAEQARITLLHVVPDAFLGPQRRRAVKEAQRMLADEARHLADRLPASVRINCVVEEGGAARRIVERAEREDAQLLVLGRGGRRLQDTFLGSTAERVLRRAQLPVLVVRLKPQGPYARPAVAVDLDPGVPPVLPWIFRLVASPRPLLHVVHAFDSPYERLAYPGFTEDERSEQKARLRQKAEEELTRMVAAGALASGRPVSDVSWRMCVRHGAARSIIQRAVTRRQFDLLGLGTRGYTGLAHAFLGSVAGDVLREVTCDVLMVPPSTDPAVPEGESI